MKTDCFKNISHIPHFYMIRAVESKLLSDYIDKSGSPFLDLGCGNGTFSKSLELQNIYGIDINKKTVNGIANNGYYKKVLIASAASIPFVSCSFKTIFSNCALEHMDQVDRVLKEVRKALKEKGKFIFTVPTPNFIKAMKEDKILSENGLNSNERISEYNKIHHHVNIFDIKDWESMLKREGFKILEHEYYLPGSIGRFIIRMDILYTIDTQQTKELRYKLEKKYMSIIGLPFRMKFRKYIENPHKWETGTNLIIKAEKI